MRYKERLVKETGQNLQTNWLPRLLLHRQKSVGKSHLAKVLSPSAKVASCSAKVAQQKLLGKGYYCTHSTPVLRGGREKSYRGRLLIGFPAEANKNINPGKIWAKSWPFLPLLSSVWI